MRLDDVIKGIKGLVTMLTLIPSPAAEEATSPEKNPCHMASANRHVILFLKRCCSDVNYELPDYSHEDNNKM